MVGDERLEISLAHVNPLKYNCFYFVALHRVYSLGGLTSSLRLWVQLHQIG